MRTRKEVASAVLVATGVMLVTAFAVPAVATGMAPVERPTDSVEDRDQQDNETVTVESITIQQLQLENVTVLTASADRVVTPNETLTNVSTNEVVVNATFRNVTLENVTIRNESLADALGVTQDGANETVDNVTLTDREIERAVLRTVAMDNVSGDVTVRNRTTETSYARVQTTVPDIEIGTAVVDEASDVTLQVVEVETSPETETENETA